MWVVQTHTDYDPEPDRQKRSGINEWMHFWEYTQTVGVGGLDEQPENWKIRKKEAKDSPHPLGTVNPQSGISPVSKSDEEITDALS